MQWVQRLFPLNYTVVINLVLPTALIVFGWTSFELDKLSLIITNHILPYSHRSHALPHPDPMDPSINSPNHPSFLPFIHTPPIHPNYIHPSTHLPIHSLIHPFIHPLVFSAAPSPHFPFLFALFIWQGPKKAIAQCTQPVHLITNNSVAPYR